MTEIHFILRKNLKNIMHWSCQNVCDALIFLLDNISIQFGTKLYRQVVGIPMGTYAPLVADLFLFCYERDFIKSLSDDKQADVIDAFNTTSRYLDDILNINNVYFDNMLSQIYPSELQVIDKGCFSEAFSFKQRGGRSPSSGLNRKPRKNPLFCL